MPHPPKKYFSGKEVIDALLPELISGNPEKKYNWQLQMSAWSMMYSMELIKNNDWKFVSERKIISEDVYSLLDLFSYIRSASVINDYLYFYCVNGESLTRKYRPDRFERIRQFYFKTLDLCKEKKYPDEIVHRVNGPFISFTIAALKQESYYIPFKNDAIRTILHDNEFINALVQYKEVELKRKVFNWAVINRQMFLCELMLWLQNKS